MPCARSAWHASWYATRPSASGFAGTSTSPWSARNSIRSWTGSSVPSTSSPYVVMCALHPDGVHDHVIRARERRRVPTGELPGRGQPSVVRRQRSAAALRPGDQSRASRCGRARGSSPGSPGGTSGPARTRRGAPPSLGRPRPPAVRSRAGSRANGEVCRGASARIRRGRNGRATGWKNVAIRKSGGMRQGDVEAEPAEEPCAAAAERFHLDARALHHPAERHVRRADVLARATHQAQVHEARRTCRRPPTVPSATERIAVIRPRGDADSSPVSR